VSLKLLLAAVVVFALSVALSCLSVSDGYEYATKLVKECKRLHKRILRINEEAGSAIEILEELPMQVCLAVCLRALVLRACRRAGVAANHRMITRHVLTGLTAPAGLPRRGGRDQADEPERRVHPRSARAAQGDHHQDADGSGA
jgi:hypothetical protein